jgi:hypothetical protein
MLLGGSKCSHYQTLKDAKQQEVNRSEIAAERETTRPRPDRVPAMETWPYPNIPPELFDTLTDDERATLEALTRTYLEHVALRQQRPPITND